MYRQFQEARDFVQKLKLKNKKEWKEYAKSKDKPKDIPSDPRWQYKNEWKGMGDWLGTGTIASFNRQYRSFKEAKEFVQKLKLKNTKEWTEYNRSKDKPIDIPARPEVVYKEEWKGMGDWLGTGYIALFNRKYRSFNEARAFVHKLGFKDVNEWTEYNRSKDKPIDIPARPEVVYKEQWVSWGDWLGTGTIASFNRQYRSFKEGKKFVHKLGLKNRNEWTEYAKSKDKPKDIPGDPRWQYKNEWKGMGDWLGTGTIANINRKYRSFKDAKEFVHKLQLRNFNEWTEYAKSKNRPKDIPANPPQAYKNEWCLGVIGSVQVLLLHIKEGTGPLVKRKNLYTN